ncbi:hypothetical protein HPULCUR_003438 [Helicostylum pulchrum]|uniref:Uncharacterized protein n=1 Tax=Helicostylum pulchrum TaxID=562976 RepID=A0ABP9XUQ3_9FUNG
MNILQNRANSFENNVIAWPYTTNHSYAKVKSIMSVALFDIELNHWKPTQSPYVRHRIESPNCAWTSLSYPDAHKEPSLADPSKACDHPRSARMRSARLETF